MKITDLNHVNTYKLSTNQNQLLRALTYLVYDAVMKQLNNATVIETVYIYFLKYIYL